MRDEDIPLLLIQTQLIDGLEQMGFRRDIAEHDWDEDAAVSELITLPNDSTAAEETITIANHDTVTESQVSLHVEQSSSQSVQDPTMKNTPEDRKSEVPSALLPTSHKWAFPMSSPSPS